MSGDLKFDLKGFAELEARLSQLAANDATKAGQSANRAGAAYAAKKVRENAPVGPTPEGAKRTRLTKRGKVEQPHKKLKNSVKVTKGRNSDPRTVENLVTINAKHAGWVELGSIHNEATHFVEKTFENEANNILEVMAAALEKGLKRRGV